jgi:diacylglycerol kinase family enzyme
MGGCFSRVRGETKNDNGVNSTLSTQSERDKDTSTSSASLRPVSNSKLEEPDIDSKNVVAVTAEGVATVRNTDTNDIPKFELSTIRAPKFAESKYQVAEAAVLDRSRAIHVIVSIKSGTCRASEFFECDVEPFLASLGLSKSNDYKVHTTSSATTVTELTTSIFVPEANKGNGQLIILLSGDGGIVDIVNGLLAVPHSELYKPPVLSIIPLGTGNALAHSTGITNDNTWGLSSLARGQPRQLPLLKATFSPGARLLTHESTQEEPLATEDGKQIMYGAVVCSWGLHAGLVADSDTVEYRKYGVERFSMAAKEALHPSDGSEPHKYKAVVSVLRAGDGPEAERWQKIQRDEHMYILATLVSNLEKTFTISPASKPFEGRLRLVHFGPSTGEEVMRVMGMAYQGGKHVEDPLIEYEDIEGLRIEFKGLEEDKKWRRICVDGKIVRVESDGWVEVRKEGHRVVDVLSLD